LSTFNIIFNLRLPTCFNTMVAGVQHSDHYGNEHVTQINVAP